MTRKLTPIFVLTLLALWPGAAGAALPPGFIGISPQHPSNADDYRLMREAGVRSVRLPLFWSSVQPRPPFAASTDWTDFDRDVELAAEQGLRVMPFLVSSPRWVTPEWNVLPVNSARQRHAWANFVRTSVHRYGPNGAFWDEHPELSHRPIRAWEIWNEMNIVTFMRDPDPVRYATLLRIAGRVLHREDPGARVLIGGLFGRPLQIPPNAGSSDFLDRLYRAGNVKPFFEGVALHPYVAEVRAMAGQLRSLRRVMRRHRDAGTKLYVTELGWGSDGGPTRWERGLWGQANRLSRSFALFSRQRQNLRLGGVWWFTWTDEAGSCQFCDSAGLLTADREAKPSWYRFNAWTGGDPGIVPRARFGG